VVFEEYRLAQVILNEVVVLCQRGGLVYSELEKARSTPSNVLSLAFGPRSTHWMMQVRSANHATTMRRGSKLLPLVGVTNRPTLSGDSSAVYS
jgi:hypothetical protein